MEEKLYFKNSKGDKLCGILQTPKIDEKNLIVILVHGHSSSKNTNTYRVLAPRLAEKGISTFRFDIYGHGESEGKFEDATVSEACDDILQAIKFVQLKGYKRVGLMGSSYGGLASIMAASKTKELSFLILKSPVSNYKDLEIKRLWKQGIDEWRLRGWTYYYESKNLKLNYHFFEDLDQNNGYEAAKKIMIPTFISHGDADEAVPIEQSKKLVSLLANGTLHIVKGAGHRYEKPEHFEEMLEQTIRTVLSNYED